MGKGKAPKELGPLKLDISQGARRAPWIIFLCPFPISLVFRSPLNLLFAPPDAILAFLWAHCPGESRPSGPSSVEENVVKCER